MRQSRGGLEQLNEAVDSSVVGSRFRMSFRSKCKAKSMYLWRASMALTMRQ